MDLVSLYQFIQTGGVIGILLVIILGGIKRWWVFGWQYRQLEASSEKWMELALKSTNLAESIDAIQKRQPPKLP